jgi:putative membrane protein
MNEHRPPLPPPPPPPPPPSALPPAWPPPPGTPTPFAVPGPDVPSRLHPISIVFEALSIGLRDAFFVVIVSVSTGWWWLLVVGAAVLAITSVLRWQRMTWRVADGRVIVDQGVLERSHREVPIDRIQQVELVRNIRHQILGVATLRIETAGSSGGSEVELAVIPLEQAERLRVELLTARDRARSRTAPSTPPSAGERTDTNGGDTAVPGAPAGPAVTPDPWAVSAGPAPEQVLLRLGALRLALAGLTGPQLLALPVVVLWLLSLLDDLPGGLDPDLAPNGIRIAGVLAVTAVVLLGIALWLGVAMAAGILTYHDLTVSRTDHELRIRRGLLDRRDLSIPLARVQVVQVGEHPILNLFGMVSLRFWSAGGVGTADATAAAIPVLTPAEAAHLLEVAVPGSGHLDPLARAPRRALPRSLVRGLAAGAVLVAVTLVLFRPSAAAMGVIAPAMIAVGLGWGVLRWRGLGATLGKVVVAGRRGALIRQTSYVPTAKVQSARVTASFFQRRRRLATTWVDVAGRRGAPGLFDRDDLEAHRVARRLTTGEARRDEQTTRQEMGLGTGAVPVA